MACRSCCRKQLTQLARRTNLERNLLAETQYYATTAASQQRLFRQLPTTTAPSQQTRGFRSTPSRAGLKDTVARLFAKGAEPYRVVAATSDIYKACAREAAYTIDPIAIKADTIPKTEEGEHIGKGEGMWHQGTTSTAHHRLHSFTHPSTPHVRIAEETATDCTPPNLDFHLPPTFSTWSQVTMLHMYLVFARIRNLDRDAARSWQSQLLDHFFFDAEARMDDIHGISSRGLRHRYLKDLFIQWRGIIAAYDEGLVKGDAVLASAVWRNVYKGREDVDVRDLAAIVSWMRLTLQMLDQMPDEALFLRASSALKWPAKNEFAGVDKTARQMGEPVGSTTTTTTTPPIKKVAV
ncbi:hypothetical protein F5Y15DRAFT_141510 [Xylariaceae sp. FL0016]|nr:hypothetical protein F5Y15DRAFT_141510 [Xylariaceae sp. FL0016]